LRVLLLILITFIVGVDNVNAQKQGNIWYFGNKAGVDFKNGDPVAITNSELNTFEGSSVLCDTSGNLLFYTDGSTVYNKAHQIMQNGTGLFGNNSSCQSACIVPNPGNKNLYYIFTVGVGNSPEGLCYSIVDISSNGGLGEVTSTKNVQLYNAAHEKLSAVGHPNGKEFWVMIQRKNSNQYLTFHITQSGLNSTPVISSGGPNSNGWYTIKANLQANKVATTGGANGNITLFDFDVNTGIMSNPIALPMQGGENYGVDFSPNGEVLYATNYVGPIVLYQWNLSAGGEMAIRNSRITIVTNSGSDEMGQVQLGPNGKIYIARRSRTFIDCINNPNVVGTGCNYQSAAVPLSGRNCGLGLPTFMQSYFNPVVDTIPEPEVDITAGFSGQNICIGDTVVFSGFVDSLKDIYFKIEGMDISGTPVKYAFSNAGEYDVKMYYKSYLMDESEDFREFSKTFKVYGTNKKVLPLIPSFCDEITLKINALEFPSVKWQPGNINTHELLINQSGKWNIELIDSNGCVLEDSITLERFNKPKAEFISDSVCIGSVSKLESLSTVSDDVISEYKWEITDGSVLSGQMVSKTFPNSGIYSVRHIVSTPNNCSDTIYKPNSIMIGAKPIVDFKTDSVCVGEISNFTSLSTISSGIISERKWELSNGVNLTGTNASYIFNNFGLYSVKHIVVSGIGCSDSLEKINIIKIGAKPVANFVTDTVCLGEANNLFSLSTIEDGSISQYVWELSNGSILFGQSETFTFLSHGLYSVKHIVFSDIGCSDTLEKINSIMVRENPIADFDSKRIEDLTEYINYEFINKSKGKGLTYLWDFGSMGISFERNPMVEYMENTQHFISLTVTDSFGCYDSISKLQTVSMSRGIYVPNAFSPNGNNLNETFKPIGIPYALKYKMEIFNRWGELLFYTEDVNVGWNGTYMGLETKQDVYMFIIRAIDYDQKHYFEAGTVTLLR